MTDFKTRAAAFWAELQVLEKKYGVHVLDDEVVIYEPWDRLPVVQVDLGAGPEPESVVQMLSWVPNPRDARPFTWAEVGGGTDGTWEEYVAFLKSKGVEP